MDINQMKYGKGSGPHGIEAEALKSDIKVTPYTLQILSTKIWN